MGVRLSEVVRQLDITRTFIMGLVIHRELMRFSMIVQMDGYAPQIADQVGGHRPICHLRAQLPFLDMETTSMLVLTVVEMLQRQVIVQRGLAMEPLLLHQRE